MDIFMFYHMLVKFSEFPVKDDDNFSSLYLLI